MSMCRVFSCGVGRGCLLWPVHSPFQSILVRWFLKRRDSRGDSCRLPFVHFQFALIHGPNIPGAYAILLFTALDLTSITSHIHNWVSFCFGFVSSFLSSLISCSILDTYWPGEVIFWCTIFLPFHAVHGVLKAIIRKWFAIPFPSGPRFVKTLHHDPSILGGPTRRGS